MPFKAKITGMNNVHRLINGLNSIAKGAVAKTFKVQLKDDGDMIKEAISQLIMNGSSDWSPLAEKTLRMRAWRGIDGDTPWYESGWLLDCLVVEEDGNSEVSADYVIDVRFASGATASHGADLDWVVWTLEYGDESLGIPPRPLISKVEEEIISSGSLERSWKKLFKEIVDKSF